MTQLELYNNALALLGHDRMIASLSDTSTELTRCNMFYPGARDSVLCEYPWEWATKTLAVGTTPVSVPANLLRVIDARDPSGNPVSVTRANGQFTAAKTATLRYVANDITISEFPGYVVEAITYALAFRLFGPILGNPTTQDGQAAQKQFFDIAQERLSTAKSLDLSEHSFMGGPSNPDALVKTDYANRALAILGSSRLIRSFDEDPCEEAVRIRQLYPMALKKVLSSYRWEFARKSATASASPYSLPADFLRLISVTDSDGKSVNARISDGTLVFDGTGAVISYTSSNVNLAKIPPYIGDLIVLAIATSMVTNFAGGDDAQKAQGGTTKTEAIAAQYESAYAAAVAAEVEQNSWRVEADDPDALTKRDIANRALALIGSPEVIKDFDNDQTPIANRMRSLYAAAFDDVLTAHDWDFTAVEKPVKLPADRTGWARISVPDDCIRLVSISNADGNPLKYRRDRDFVHIESLDGQAVIRYVSKDISIADSPHKFREAVVYTLASLISASEKDGIKISGEFLNRARVKISDAVSKETDETAFRGKWENPFIKARG